MSDLTEFLLARVAEDEARSSEWTYTQDLGIRTRIVRFHPGAGSARVWAECEAKRRIVEDQAVYAHDLKVEQTPFAEGRLFMATLAVARLAAVYADHPGYREEWRP